MDTPLKGGCPIVRSECRERTKNLRTNVQHVLSGTHWVPMTASTKAPSTAWPAALTKLTASLASRSNMAHALSICAARLTTNSSISCTHSKSSIKLEWMAVPFHAVQGQEVWRASMPFTRSLSRKPEASRSSSICMIARFVAVL